MTDGRKLARDGHHVDGAIGIPEAALFDRQLPDVAVLAYAVLASTGLRLGLGLTLNDLGAELGTGAEATLESLQALRDRRLIDWTQREGRYYVVLLPVGSGLRARAHHAVIHDPEIPVRAKRTLWASSVDPYADDEVLAAQLGWPVEEVRHWIDTLTMAGYIRRGQERRGWLWWRRTVERWVLTPMEALYYWPPAPPWRAPARPRVLTAADFRAMPYSDYLRTPAWKAIRTRVLDRDNRTCQGCGSQQRLVAHHLRYDHRGDEHGHLEDLVTLCTPCHNAVHGRASVIHL